MEVPNHLDLRSWDHLGVPGKVSREEAYHQAHQGPVGLPDPKDHPGSFQGLQVQTKEETASPLEGRADLMNQGD